MIIVSPHYVNFGARARRVAAVSAVVLGLFSIPALAAVSCTVSATTTNFGVYDPLSAAATVTTGTVTATCTLVSGGTTTVNLVSSYSAGSSGVFSTRTMLSGAQALNYNLYFDTAYTQIRGDGTGGSQTGSATLTLTTSNRTQSATGTIYARAPAGQDVAAGSYSDTITVTVTY